jgi:hypothetical protein
MMETFRAERKIIRQDLQDCAGSLFLPESADEKHVNPVDYFLPLAHLDAFNPINPINPTNSTNSKNPIDSMDSIDYFLPCAMNPGPFRAFA